MDKNQKLIELCDVSVSFDDQKVLDALSLSICDGEFVTLLGPSGCGKTTTLRIIAGFIEPDEGDVFFGSERINGVPPHKRQVNTIFQRYALFPHYNVFDNVAYGLRVRGVPKEEIKERVHEMLRLVNLEGLEHRKISKLSGGQQQRVAVARAVINRPRVLLLDEPLAALDLKLRKDMQRELKNIQKQLGITFIFVTHDQEEALSMSDTVVVMDNRWGRPRIYTTNRSTPLWRILSENLTFWTVSCPPIIGRPLPDTHLTVWMPALRPVRRWMW